jgi:hypothetical protein
MLSAFIVVVVLVLYASGWKEFLFGKIRNRWIVIFLTLWLIGSRIAIPVGAAKLSGSLAIAGIAAIAGLCTAGSAFAAVHLLSACMLASSVHVFILQLQFVHPLLLPYEPQRISAVLVGVLAACTAKGILQQTAVATIGLLLGEGLLLWIAREPLPGLIGDAGFFDLWWLVLAICRIVQRLIEGLRRLRDTGMTAG